MKTPWKVVTAVAAGLVVSGIAFAATKPALVPVPPIKKPSVVMYVITGRVIDQLDGGAYVVTVTTPKKLAGDYTFNVDENTQVYYRNGVLMPGSAYASGAGIGDTVTVWSLKLKGGTAIKILNQRQWVGHTTGIISAVTQTPTDPTLSETPRTMHYFTVTDSGKRAYAVVARNAFTEFVSTTSSSTTTATWAQIVSASKVRVDGTWNDTAKLLIATKITIVSQ